MTRHLSIIYSVLALLALTGLPGCGSAPDSPRSAVPSEVVIPAPVISTPAPISPPAISGITLQAVDMNNPVRPTAMSGPVPLAAAKNEWVSFAVRLSGLPRLDGSVHLSLAISGTPAQSSPFSPSSIDKRVSFFQVLPMPVDLNRAGYIRQTGLSAGNRELPRALLPLKSERGALGLQSLRDPQRPTDPNAHPGGEANEPVLIWVDLHVPADTAAGAYTAVCNVTDENASNAQSTVSVPLSLTVYDFAIPDERHLQMVSRVDWESLQRHYPAQTEAITPRLINRRDATYTPIVGILDALVKLGQEHRANVVIPRLQPTVKWTPGEPPQADWEDFDSLISPWLDGDAFTDKVALGYWPLPTIDYLDNFDPASQQQYWRKAAVHFSQQNWLTRAAVFIDAPLTQGAKNISTTAARALVSHPLLQVSVPLEDDQLVLADTGSSAASDMIQPQTIKRLAAASPGLVFAPTTRPWPAGVERPNHWLRTDLPGLVPYVGAGADERDVRLWAWLAFLRDADQVLWTSALPAQHDPDAPADPNSLIWFYPGSWFGVDGPVPTIQLKWLRRAQQDYEYLWLANQRGKRINALVLARLMTKQVQIAPDQTPDPVYALLSGTTDQKTWDQAMALLARTILLQRPGDPVNDTQSRALNVDMEEWQAPKERPYLIPRTANWSADPYQADKVDLTWGIDVYNASDRTIEGASDGSTIGWATALGGWEFHPEPVEVPRLQTYAIRRVDLQARFDLTKLTAPERRPLSVMFLDGYTQQRMTSKAILPIALSDRREGHLTIDGNLDDWDESDRIQDGYMVKALDRPTLQHQQLAFAPTQSQVYTSWADENFYVAFKVSGVSGRDLLAYKNFADYQFRRAWGDDLCEILVQAVYPNNVLGPVLHVVCKPNAPWTEKKPAGAGDNAWAPWEGAAVRYAATIEPNKTDPDNADWRGEVAIPWKAIFIEGKGRPTLLRFNFTEHHNKSGETGSWAGPIDYGRDDQFMGLLYVRDKRDPGMVLPRH